MSEAVPSTDCADAEKDVLESGTKITIKARVDDGIDSRVQQW